MPDKEGTIQSIPILHISQAVHQDDESINRKYLQCTLYTEGEKKRKKKKELGKSTNRFNDPLEEFL